MKDNQDIRFARVTPPDFSLEHHFKDIVDSLPDGLITVDKEWRVTSLNRAAEKLLGVSERKSIGRFCYKVIRGEHCRSDCPLAITLETQRNVRDFEVPTSDQKGGQRTLSVSTAVLRDSDGTPIGGVISLRDMTLMNRLRDDLLGKTGFHGLIGKSRAMRELFDLIREVADCDSNVLVEGESGTGKELVAKAIQRLSSRRDNPYVRVNCAAFVETLLESELFGHVRGAFTGAHLDRPGRFEMADKGTIFLDEIGESSPAVQMKLLRVLQERELERVGGNETIQVDVRVISATNIPLESLVSERRFRDDLYYRLNVIPITIRPLRERTDDIIPLTEFFLERRRLIVSKDLTISPGAMALLMEYRWPGNVRELENALEHASVRCQGVIIQKRHLPNTIRKSKKGGGEGPAEDAGARRVLEALRAARWNRAEAARRLGISRTTLWRQMSKYGLIDDSKTIGYHS